MFCENSVDSKPTLYRFVDINKAKIHNFTPYLFRGPTDGLQTLSCLSFLWLCQSRLTGGGIVFSTCPPVRPSVRLFVCYIRYL